MGLFHYEAELYVYIDKNGTTKEEDMVKMFFLRKKEVCKTLRNLRQKNLVKANRKSTLEFSAIEFEIVLSLFAGTKKETVREWERDKKKIRANWHSLLVSYHASYR